MSKRKILIIAPVLLVLGVGAIYKVAHKPPPVVVKKKIDGAVVPMQQDFLLNLNGGRYARVAIALVMPTAPEAAEGASPAALPQEAAVRAIVTDELTGVDPKQLIIRAERKVLVKRIRTAIHEKTDEEVDQVLVTDVTVQ